MCGLAGLISVQSPPGEAVALRMADALAHRGPDDHGSWHDDRLALAHRRLAVIDPGPAGRQPMVTPDGRFVIAYNGEMYNDAEVRTALRGLGVRFCTNCDTETVLHAVAHWGLDARDRLRGMYAFAAWDTRDRTLLLARDELGVKPLYLARLSPRELAFASEPAALFQHPGLSPRPDPVVVSAYLSTIRVTLGRRTLFGGVEAVEPGEWIEVDASEAELHLRRHAPMWHTVPAPSLNTRAAVTDAVRSQLRADVPTCCLLSGGLDSSVISALARASLPALDTYCAGSQDADAKSEDFAHARAVADHIGSRHAEAPVSRELFTRRWPELVDAAGLPLCTPNEVAINEVARTLRADGKVVTLSGEGADELFGGYSLPLMLAHDHIAGNADASTDPGHALSVITWISADVKAALLNTPGDDEALRRWMADLHADTRAQIDADFPNVDEAERRLHTALRLQRRVNLPNLLRRLDQATMLASVEGRTPYADRVIVRHAETLPMADRFRPHPTEPGTKLSLRRAFADRLPQAVTSRPKASFPLPFEGWLDGATAALDSAFARELFTPSARDELSQNPAALWNIAWPALNLALWGQRWWGR